MGHPVSHPVLGTVRPTGCGQGDCACPAGKCRWNPQPSTMTQLRGDGTPITEILTAADVVAPGGSIQGYTAGKTCECEACQALYAELTAHLTTTAPEGTAP